MVKMKLPFLPPGDSVIPGLGVTVDDKLNFIICEQYYYLQPFTGLSDSEVEEEDNYSPRQKMLIAELSAYFALCDKTLVNVAGSGGGPATGAKRIKRGKADVVEGDFEYGKSSDGSFLGMTAKELLMKFATRACEIAALLNYVLPFCEALGLCSVEDSDVPPLLFIKNEDLNCNC